MAEGPQVLLRTEWLRRHLSGRRYLHATTTREPLRPMCEAVSGRMVVGAACAGKHIFIELEGDVFLHNHLLMRGRWRRYQAGLLFPPEGAWLCLDTGPSTICNLHGQKLSLATGDDVDGVRRTLGPDAMDTPYPRKAISERLRGSALEIAEALLDQSVLAGVGNTAKSEILFVAGIDPRRTGPDLSAEEMDRVTGQIRTILWESYTTGGRWVHRVDRRRGQPCEVCRAPIGMVRRAPSKRSTYYCANCQN